MKRIYTLLLFFLMLLCLFGQKFPMDPSIRHGKLANGLTYYIQKNNYPENRADFYLAQKVGSMQEEDDQAGLAHFLEHMAFAGTKNFPSKLVDNLEKYGVKMGNNINAYTGFDQTVYYLSNIPTENAGLIDTCLLILHDWSGFIALRDEDIDKERGVIKEEWRSRTGAHSRIWDKQLPVIFEGSKYADRMPIGKMEIVENFEYQTLKDYYHKWYRPDLQTVIVVGNVDLDYIESQLKTIYEDFPMPEGAAERIYYKVGDNKVPIVSIETDKESTNTSLTLYMKHDIYDGDRNTKEYLTQLHLRNMISSMLSSRLREMGQKAETPFSYAYGGYGNFFVSKTKDAWSMGAGVKEGRIEETLEILIREQERVKQHGFIDSEIDRAKINLLKGYENSFNNKDKRQNSVLVNTILNSSMVDGPLTGIEYEYNLLKEIVPTFNNETLQALAKKLISDKNIVLTISGPEKDGLVYPSKEVLLEIIEKVSKETVEAYVETLSDDPLVTELPPSGKIVDAVKGEKFDETVWTLSNGMKVVLKKTKHHNDQILMSSTAYGGTTYFDDSEYNDFRFIGALANIGGVGNFSTIDIVKKLAGKSVSVSPFIGQNMVGVNGTSIQKDIETLFELTYLYLTSVRKDEEAFKSFIEKQKNAILNDSKNPMYIYGDSIRHTSYGEHPRAKKLEISDLEKINYDRMIELYKESLSNHGQFIFYFVGTVDEDVMKPLVEKYIASLPAGKTDITFKDINMDIRKGDVNNHFRQFMETPKASSYMLYTSHIAYNENTPYNIEVLNNILSQVFFRAMRTEKSGVYGTSANVGITQDKLKDNTSLRISFTSDPARLEEMNGIVYKELQELGDDGPKQDEFDKAIEYVVNKCTEWNEMNGFWLSVLNAYHFYGQDVNTDYVSRIRAITTSDVQQIMKNIMSAGNKVEVVMLPQE